MQIKNRKHNLTKLPLHCDYEIATQRENFCITRYQ